MALTTRNGNAEEKKIEFPTGGSYRMSRERLMFRAMLKTVTKAISTMSCVFSDLHFTSYIHPALSKMTTKISYIQVSLIKHRES